MMLNGTHQQPETSWRLMPAPLQRIAANTPTWVAPVLVTLLALALRAWRLDQLSVWLDEVYVIEYIHMPWRDVLGLHGAYDNHPPFYFALVKTVAIFTPDASAARYISVAAGALTIPLLYLLTRRLVNRPAALLASLILATSPLHVWYSREGRMYALAMLLVLFSYYALVRFLPEVRWRWGSLYTISLLLAMYVDYSALYPLASQVIVVAWMAARNGRRIVIPWALAAGVAAVGFLPIASFVFASVQFVARERVFLEVSLPKMIDAFLSIGGFPGARSNYWGPVETPRVLWSEIEPASAALISLLVLFSAVTLSGRYRLAFVTGISLLCGTIAVAASSSYLVSPGFADRTVCYSVLGWSLLAGSAASGRVPNGGRRLTFAAAALVIATSLATLWQVNLQGDKEHYRELAVRTSSAAASGIPVVAIARPDRPVIADSRGLISTGIQAYAPATKIMTVDKMGQPPAFWHTYSDYEWETGDLAAVQQEFAGSSYERVLHQWFAPRLYLDLYVHRSAIASSAQPLPAFDSGPGANGMDGWVTDAGRVVATPIVLTLVDSDDLSASATIMTTAEPGVLYLLTYLTHYDLPVGEIATTMRCIAASGATLQGEVRAVNAADFPDQGWNLARSAILCPAGATMLQIAIANTGYGDAQLRNMTLAPVTSETRLVSETGAPAFPERRGYPN